MLDCCRLNVAWDIVNFRFCLLTIIMRQRGGAKKLQLVNISAYFALPFCHSLNMKGSLDSPGKKPLILYTLSLCHAKILGSKAMFLKSIFSSNRIVLEFYFNDPCSYFSFICGCSTSMQGLKSSADSP